MRSELNSHSNIRNFRQHDSSKTTDFWGVDYSAKNACFWPSIPYPRWTASPATRFLTPYFSNRWNNMRLKFLYISRVLPFKLYFQIGNKTFQKVLKFYRLSGWRVFAICSNISTYNLRTTLYFSKFDCFIRKDVRIAIRITISFIY